jgi:hypothetical protein
MQKTVALSTAEAEYYSASEMAIEILYLRNLLANMWFPEGLDTPVYEDNTACIEWGNHVIGGRERAKHIDIQKHFANEVIQERAMKLIKVATGDQLADMFTSWLEEPDLAGLSWSALTSLDPAGHLEHGPFTGRAETGGDKW